MPAEILRHPEPSSASQAAVEGRSATLASRSTAGEQLDHGLAMDQRLREARNRVMQRRINRAHQLEARARTTCVGAGLASILLWIVLLSPLIPIPPLADTVLLEVLRQLAILVSVIIGLTLPVGGIVAVSAGQWRKLLLRRAGAQHLMVQDPGRIDYP